MVVDLLRSGGAAGATGGDLLLGVLGPEALAGDLDEVRAVRQAIEGGRGEERLAEEVGPFSSVAVGSQEDGATFVPLVNDVVEILGAGRPQRFEPEVVEDQ